MSGQIFISYKAEDLERIKPLVRVLERQGWSVWWDRKIPPGRTFDEVIEEAIDEAKCIIVIWSEKSVSSKWVRTEASEGERRGILIPVLIDNVKIPLAFRRIEAAQLVGWDGISEHPELDGLLASVAKLVGRPPTAEPDRPAAEKTEAQRLADEQAEQKAEAERIAAEKAEARRRAAEKAEAGRLDAEKTEAESVTAASTKPLWSLTLLTAIGWAIGGATGFLIGWAIGWAIGAAIGGFVTGIALRLKIPDLQWKQVLIVTIGWTIGAAIGAVIGAATDEALGWAIGMAIRGAIGGFVTGIALRLKIPDIHWKQVLIVTIGWAIGDAIRWAIDFAFGGALGGALGWAILWAIGGTIGGGVMFWQLRRAQRSV